MTRKQSKTLLTVLGVMAAVFGSCIYIVYQSLEKISYDNEFKTLLQSLEMPERKLTFVLFTDLEGFNRTWSVYEMPMGTEVTQQMKAAHNREGVLFFNWSEGEHRRNPKIEILNGKYLVFSRGGLYHSLYDIEAKRTLVNVEGPWHFFMEAENKNEQQNGSKSRADRDARLDAWVRENIHSKIEGILSGKIPVETLPVDK